MSCIQCTVILILILIYAVASVALISPLISSVLEDGSEGGMSSVEVCVQLVLSYPFPLDRDVFVILDAEDVTTGQSIYSHMHNIA